MARKTIDIAQVKERLNTTLAVPSSQYHEGAFEGKTPEQIWRLAIASFAEGLLLGTGTYQGFGYLPSEVDWSGNLKPDYDDTRRKYY